MYLYHLTLVISSLFFFLPWQNCVASYTWILFITVTATKRVTGFSASTLKCGTVRYATTVLYGNVFYIPYVTESCATLSETDVWFRPLYIYIFFSLTHCGRVSRFAFLTRWNSVHLQVLHSATPQWGMFPEVSHPQALLGFLLSIFWKFQFTKIVSEFAINF